MGVGEEWRQGAVRQAPEERCRLAGQGPVRARREIGQLPERDEGFSELFVEIARLLRREAVEDGLPPEKWSSLK